MAKVGDDEFEPRRGSETVPSTEPEVVVDLSVPDATRRRLRRLAHPSRAPESPPCPQCNGVSELEVIDLTADGREQRCSECGYGWTVDIAR